MFLMDSFLPPSTKLSPFGADVVSHIPKREALEQSKDLWIFQGLSSSLEKLLDGAVSAQAQDEEGGTEKKLLFCFLVGSVLI